MSPIMVIKHVYREIRRETMGANKNVNAHKIKQDEIPIFLFFSYSVSGQQLIGVYFLFYHSLPCINCNKQNIFTF